LGVGVERWTGTLTLAASGPGDYASITSGTISSLAATDIVVVSISGTTRPMTTAGQRFGVYVYSIDTVTNKIVVKADTMQTPAVTIQYTVHTVSS